MCRMLHADTRKTLTPKNGLRVTTITLATLREIAKSQAKAWGSYPLSLPSSTPIQHSPTRFPTMYNSSSIASLQVASCMSCGASSLPYGMTSMSGRLQSLRRSWPKWQPVRENSRKTVAREIRESQLWRWFAAIGKNVWRVIHTRLAGADSVLACLRRYSIASLSQSRSRLW